MALSLTKVEDEVEPVAVDLGALATVAVAGETEDAGEVAGSVSFGGTGGTEEAKAVAATAADASEDAVAVPLVDAVVDILFEECELTPKLYRELEPLSKQSRLFSFNRGVLKSTNCLGSLLKALIK
ncbi:MAG: hypothetical protein MR514_04440 [Succinivibrio sp.]|nr:hypothetical protein [Succinivibrio sp.]